MYMPDYPGRRSEGAASHDCPLEYRPGRDLNLYRQRETWTRYWGTALGALAAMVGWLVFFGFLLWLATKAVS